MLLKFGALAFAQNKCWPSNKRVAAEPFRYRMPHHSGSSPRQSQAVPVRAASSESGNSLVNQKTSLLVVAAVALVNSDRQVLLASRPPGKDMAGLWEFPGGKVEDSETPEAALIRELGEELDIKVDSNSLSPLTFASHTYAKADGKAFHLLMPLYVCRQWKGKPQAVEGQQLSWASAEELVKYEMPPADVPLVPIIQSVLQS